MSVSLIRGVDPNGEVRTIAVTEDGEIRVTGISGGGSSGGGSAGTEYTEGDQDTTITGTAVMWEDTGNTLTTISKDTPLPVAIAGLMAALDELKANILALSSRLPEALVDGKLSVDGSDVIQPVVGNVNVANFPATQPISATSLPLPEGAASNLALTQLLHRIPLVGTKAAAASLPVVLSSDGPFSTNFGASTEPPADSDTASVSFLRLFKRLLQSTTSLLGRLPHQQGRLAVVPRTVIKKFRDDFPGTALDLSKWEIVQTGAGQSISVATSELTIASGTTPNSETIIRSRDTYTIAFRIFAIARLTQRIINQEFYLELIDATGQHYGQLLFDGINSTNARFQSANGGNSIGLSTMTGLGQSQFFQVFEIDSFIDEINATSRPTDSPNSRVPGAVRTRQIPDPNLEYYVQIRVKNLAASPASSTSFIFDSIAIQDIEELTAEVTGGRGGGNANQAIPTSIVHTVPISGSISDAAAFGFLELSTPLAANASANSAGRIMDGRTIVRGWVTTDVSGTLHLEFSHDSGTTWRSLQTVTVAGSATTSTPFEIKVYSRFFRVRYVNGPNPQTVFQVISSLFSLN